jgi:hypothetical protein
VALDADNLQGQRDQGHQVDQDDQPPAEHHLHLFHFDPGPVAPGVFLPLTATARISGRGDYRGAIHRDHYLGHKDPKRRQTVDRPIEQPRQFLGAGFTDRLGQRLRIQQHIAVGFCPGRPTPPAQPVGHLIGREPDQAHHRHITEQQLRQGVGRANPEQKAHPIQLHLWIK